MQFQSISGAGWIALRAAICFVIAFFCCATVFACEVAGFEKVPLEQLDAGLAKYAALHSWQLLDDEKFKKNYLKLVKKFKNADWIREIDVVANPGIPYAYKEGILFLYSGNKSRAGNKTLKIVFDPISFEIYGKVQEMNIAFSSVEKVSYFGRTQNSIKNLLDCGNE